MAVAVYRFSVAFRERLASCPLPIAVMDPQLVEGAEGLLRECAGGGGFGEWLSPAGLDAWLRADTVTSLAALRRDGRLGGLVGLSRVVVGGADRWSIPFLLVGPGDRGRGVGSGLVRRVLDEAADGGGMVVHAETSTMWPAAAFWDRVHARLAT